MSRQRPTIRLFGSVEVQRAETPGADTQTISLRRKTRALLAYLASTEQTHTRHKLSVLFFPESNDPRSALRWQLSQIRRNVGADVLAVSTETVAFDHAACWVDTREFTGSLGDNAPDISLKRLLSALNLYRADFLSDMSLPDAPEFELWLVGVRARLQRLYELGMGAAIEQLIASEQLKDALAWSQRLVSHNPLLEDAHLRLAWLYAQTGQRDAALAQIATCVHILQEELAVDPTPELLALRGEIESGQALQRPQVATLAAPVADLLPAVDDFVGRTSELARLMVHWQRSMQGPERSAVVLVEAEAGGGKSRLLAEWARQLPAGAALLGHCYESTRTQPFRPWIDLIEQTLLHAKRPQLDALSPFYLRHLAYLVPAVMEHLPEAADLLAGMSDVRQEHLFGAVAEFLGKAMDGNHLVVIDDLQWADESSLRLFYFLAQRTARLPMVMAGAFRSEEVNANEFLRTLLGDLNRIDAERLKLTNLSATAILELIETVWAELPPEYRPHISNMLHESTGGNPLFVTEVIRELRSSDELPEELPVPDTVLTLVQRRLAKMPSDSRQVLEALSVVGIPATLDVARQTSARSEDETVDAIEWGLRQGILTAPSNPGTYLFTHDLVRHAVFAQLSPVRRQVLHRRAATTLESIQASPAILTHHWRLAGDAGREARTALLAGEQAMAQAANTEALEHFTRALALLPWEERAARYRALIARSELYMILGERDAQQADLTALQPVIEELGDAEKRIEVTSHWTMLHILRSNYSEACVYAQQTVELAQAANAMGFESEGHSNWGMALWHMGKHDEARVQLQQAYQQARTVGRTVTECNSLILLGNIASNRNDAGQAVTYFEQALPLAQRAGFRVNESTILNNLGLAKFRQGDYGAALAYYEQAEPITLAIGFRMGQAHTKFRLGWLYLTTGAWSQARTCIDQAVELYREMNYPRGLRDCALDSALIYGYMGDLARARDAFDSAVQAAQSQNLETVEAPMWMRWGHLLFDIERVDEATAAYQWALNLQASSNEMPSTQTPDALECRSGLALAYQAQGESAAALREIETVLRHIDPNKTEHYSDPLRILFACYRVQQEAAHPDALRYLRLAQQLLQKRSESIPMPELRATFLNSPPLHVQIMQAPTSA